MTHITPNSEVKLSLNQAAAENVRTGVLLLCKEACVTAMLDRRLLRGHLAVLASIAMCINNDTARAWPSRQTIALMAGMDDHTVSNRLLELRKMGYLVAERQRVPEAGNRSLSVYTFGKVDHATIRREIGKFVMEMRARAQGNPNEPASPPAGTFEAKSPPAGTASSPPAGTMDLEVPAGSARKSPPAVDSNSSNVTQEESKRENAPKTFKQLIWQDGLSVLVSLYNGAKTADDLRPRLGKLYSQFGAGRLLDAIVKAEEMKPIEPMDFITKLLGGSKPRSKLPSGFGY